MNEGDVITYLLTAFERVETNEAYGYRFFYVGAERKLPWATLANDDSDYDSFSTLRRPGVFRLNIGVKPETYTRLLGERPVGLGRDGIVETGHDFTALDTLLPHPQYAPQSWVCILSPGQATFEEVVKPLLDEAWGLADKRAR